MKIRKRSYENPKKILGKSCENHRKILGKSYENPKKILGNLCKSYSSSNKILTNPQEASASIKNLRASKGIPIGSIEIPKESIKNLWKIN